MRTLETVLAETPFLEGLDDERLALLAGCAGNVHFGAGETIFRQGDRADAFYVLRHGSVALETFVPTRGPVVIETIEGGEVLGWSWLFAPYRWHFDARALTGVRATGEHLLRARAHDASGRIQATEPAWSRGGFANTADQPIPVHVLDA